MSLTILSGAVVSEIFLRWKGWYRTYSETSGRAYQSLYSHDTLQEYLLRYPPDEDSFVLQLHESRHVRLINDLGYTDVRSSREFRENDGIKILTLGDSFTEGVGAKEDGTWSAHFEAALNGELLDSKHCFVYNAGISGSDPFFEFQAMKFLVPVLQPDVVVILMNPSDFYEVYVRGGWDRFQNGKVIKTRKAPWWEEPFYSKSFLARWIVHRFGYNHMLTRASEKEIREETTPLILDALDSCAFIAYKHDIFLMSVFHPFPSPQAGQRSYGAEYNDDFARTLYSRFPATAIDLTPVIEGHWGPEYYWKEDGHCTSEGYKLFADAITVRLRSSYYAWGDSMLKQKK